MAVVVSEQDVVFAQAGGRDLRCDIYRPAGAGSPLPAAIMLHGGGWRRGSRASLQARAEELAQYGFVVVASEYRLTDEARWPAHIQDVKAALRWLRADAAARDVNPDQIALIGFSAGAQLALLAAGTPGVAAFSDTRAASATGEAVNAVVAFFPPTRFQAGSERAGGEAPASPAESLGPGITADEMRDASPLTHLSAQFPPTMLLHGTADEVVPPATSQELFGMLRALGVPADLRLYTGLRHEFVRMDGVLQLSMADVALFLRRTMIDPKRFDVSQAELFGAPAAPGGGSR